MDDIGDYYDRIDRQRREAHKKWTDAIKAFMADPSEENRRVMVELREKMIDAGNTGD